MTLIELVLLLFSFNLMAFGNGPVLFPLLQASLVDERRVLTMDQLLYAYAIARVTPGQNNVYIASIGYMLFGLPGAVFLTLAIMLPGYSMLALIIGYERFRTTRLVQDFARGVTSASVGVIFAVTVAIGRSSLESPVAWLVFIMTIGLIYVLKWNPILSLLLVSALGITLNGILSS